MRWPAFSFLRSRVTTLFMSCSPSPLQTSRRSFGKVFKARNEQTSQLAAVKIVPVEQDTGEVSREIETLKQCSSENIVQYFGSHTKDGELWIVMEFCAGSSLADIMEVRAPISLRPPPPLVPRGFFPPPRPAAAAAAPAITSHESSR